jgi:ribosome modulation factor
MSSVVRRSIAGMEGRDADAGPIPDDDEQVAYLAGWRSGYTAGRNSLRLRRALVAGISLLLGLAAAFLVRILI